MKFLEISYGSTDPLPVSGEYNLKLAVPLAQLLEISFKPLAALDLAGESRFEFVFPNPAFQLDASLLQYVTVGRQGCKSRSHYCQHVKPKDYTRQHPCAKRECQGPRKLFRHSTLSFTIVTDEIGDSDPISLKADVRFAPDSVCL